MGGSGGTGEPRKGSGLMDPTQADPQRVVLHGAAFGHWSAAPQVSWASILSPRWVAPRICAVCGRKHCGPRWAGPHLWAISKGGPEI